MAAAAPGGVVVAWGDGGCPILEKVVFKDDGPRKGPQATRGVRGVRVAKAESVHRVCRFMRK